MKKISALLLFIVSTTALFAQESRFFLPYKTTSLRLPAVPILMNDTYFSIWSPFDKLNDGPTFHWTETDKPIDGLLRVDGKTYRFMGSERQYVLGDALLPMADTEAWTGRVNYEVQSDNKWAALNFDDSAWQEQQGAFGEGGEYPNVRTRWVGADTDIYVRRAVEFTAEDLQKDLYIVYSHDDVFELFINGTRVIKTGETWLQGETYHLTASDKALLKEGSNVIAAHCHNTTGGAYLDYGIFENRKTGNPNITPATQKSCNVLATNTYYTFSCGPVDLTLVFTAPMLMDDLELLSTPINYVSFRVRSTDGQQHNVQFYMAVSSELCINDRNQAINTLYYTDKETGTNYIRSGNQKQNYLNRAGDGICIDWGYLYLPEINGTVARATQLDAENDFQDDGQLDYSIINKDRPRLIYTSKKPSDHPLLTFIHDFGDVTTDWSFTMIGYDEIQSMQYNFKNYKAYWAEHDGKTKTIFAAFKEMADNYSDIMSRCRQQDQKIYDAAFKSGNRSYAELLSAVYRQTIGAHVLFQDEHGHLLFFSKENNSGGFVNTLDVTYPSQPLYLLYNLDLAKGMLTSILEYCESDDWGFNFGAHDIGTYPHANGQNYSIRKPNADGGFEGNMPIEESGNMLTLVATITMLEGNADYALEHWETLKTWADYCSDNGQDPENQLCTDDFAGHLAHNANLSIKAIMGVLAFSEIARYAGQDDVAATYLERAKTMARTWKRMAVDSSGDHYKLTLDRNGTWSQKYNLVWDYLWDTNVFDKSIMETEINYYLNKQNRYGLPLDSRDTQTKSDWIIWTASMANDKETFVKFTDPIWLYAHETRSRVPLSDWHRTTNAERVGFKARSVVGGYWMRVLMDNFDKKDPQSTGIRGISANGDAASDGIGDDVVSIHDVQGRRLSATQTGLNIVRFDDGSAKKIVVE